MEEKRDPTNTPRTPPDAEAADFCAAVNPAAKAQFPIGFCEIIIEQKRAFLRSTTGMTRLNAPYHGLP